MLRANLGEGDRTGLLVLLVVFLHQVGDELVHLDVGLGRILGGAGNDQRRSGLIDEDRIHFVDDGEVELALHHLLQLEFHVVAQVVEAELIIGAVGDIGGVGVAALLVRKPRHDAADGKPQEAVDLAHPGGVAARQVIVHRDHMNAQTAECVQVDRKGCDQGFTLTGFHLRDHALVEDDAAQELNVEMALPQGALGRLPDRRKGLDQEIVQSFACLHALAEPLSAGCQVFVAEGLQFRLKGIDGVDGAAIALQEPIVGRPEQPLGESA